MGRHDIMGRLFEDLHNTRGTCMLSANLYSTFFTRWQVKLRPQQMWRHFQLFRWGSWHFPKKWNGAFMQLNAVPIRLASNKLSGMWWGKAKPKWIGGRRCDWCDMSRIDPGLRITSSSSATHQRISCNASQFHLLHLAAAVVVNFWIRLWWSVHQPGKKINFLTCSLNLSLPPHFISPASWWDNRMELRHQKRSSVSPSPPSLFLNACKGELLATDRPLHARLVLTDLLQKKLVWKTDFILHWSLLIQSMGNMLQTDAGWY